MATTERVGILTYVDESANQTLLYPVTTMDAVDGLEDAMNNVDKKVDTLRGIVSKFHSNIVETASGEVIQLYDASDLELAGLRIFGKTQQRTTTGKNLFDSTIVTNRTAGGITTQQRSDGGIKLTGTSTTEDRYAKSDSNVFMTLPAGSYTLSPSNMRLRDVSDTVRSGTFTLTETTEFKEAIIKVALNATYNEVIYIQLESGSTATAYEPYTRGIPSPSPEYPQALESVGDGGSVTTTVCGKNLLKNTAEDGWITCKVHQKINPDGTVILNSVDGAQSEEHTRMALSLTLEPGDYIVTGVPTGVKAQMWVSLGGKRIATGEPGAEQSFNVEATSEISVRLYIFAGNVYTNAVISPMIRLAGTDATYEPYKDGGSVTVTPVTGEGKSLHLPGIPVTSGGNYTDANGNQWICD